MAEQASWYVQLISSSIPAVTGLIGVWLGVSATTRREARRDAKNEMAERLYLSTLLTAALERFIDECDTVVCDYGREEPSKPGHYSLNTPFAPLPKFDPMSIQGNWKALSGEIMDRVFLLPYQIHQTEGKIDGYSEEASAPDYQELFDARHYFYAKLALIATKLVDDIRSQAGLKRLERNEGAYSREERLQTALDNHQALFE